MKGPPAGNASGPDYVHGSLGRTRTCNLVVNSHPLCRLSYQGTCVGRQENIIPTASYVKRNRRSQIGDVDEFSRSWGTEISVRMCVPILRLNSSTSPFCGVCGSYHHRHIATMKRTANTRNRFMKAMK